jgi:arsenical pump membrane protein
VVSNLGLHVLARKGVSIGWGDYFKVGVLLTVRCCW